MGGRVEVCCWAPSRRGWPVRRLTDAGFHDATLAADTGFNLVMAARG